VDAGAAELLHGHIFARDGLDDVRAGDEHVAGLLDHEDEVGDDGRVDRTAGAGPHDGRDLRDDTARKYVAGEDVGVACKADDALLDACAARVVETDDRRPRLHRQVHDLADLLGKGAREGAAEDGEVLREDIDNAAVDAAIAGDDAVAGDALLRHVEVVAAVGLELVGLDEGAGVEQQVDALTRRQLAGLVLLGDAVCAAATLSRLIQLRKTLQIALHDDHLVVRFE